MTGNRPSFPLGVGKEVTLGILGERDLIDTPISVKRFDEQFVRNTQSVRVADFAQRDASFNVFGPPANSALDDAFLRGFSITADQYTWNGYYPAETRDFPIEMIETIDILKGPTGLVSVTRPSSATPGGTLNINTKSPLASDLTRLSARFIGDGVFGGHADISRRFGAGGSFGIRANIAYRKGEPIKDTAREESLLAHLAFSYETDRLRIVAEGFYQDYTLRGRSAAVLYRAGVPVLERVPDYERLASPSWTYLETERQAGQLRVNYDITDTLEAFGAFTAGDGGLEVKSADVTVIDASGNATATGSFFSRRTPGIAGDGGLRWKYEGGGFTNTATVTASFFESRFGTSTRLNGVNLNAGIFSIYDYDALIGVPNFNSGFDPGDPIPIIQETDGRSVAFVNDLSLLDNRLSIIAGLRWNEFHQKDGAGATIYKEDAFSPSVGVVFKPTGNTSIYASYMEALEAGRSAPVNAVNAGDVTAPARSHSYEIGAKADFGSFGATVAVFEITRPSAYLDPDTRIFDLFGRARHRGVEADIFGEVARGLRVYGSLAYLDAELAQDANPALIGNRPAAVPEWAVAGGFDADVPFVPDLAVTGAFRHTGARFFESANLRTVDDFTIFDLGLRYGFRLNETDLVARLNVANIFDERYYAGANGLTSPGETRNMFVSLTADF